MHIGLPTNTSVKDITYLQIELCIQSITAMLIIPIIRNCCTFYIFPTLGLIMQILASAIFHGSSSLAEVLGKDQLGCHYAQLVNFGSKDCIMILPVFNIFNRYLVVIEECFSKQVTKAPPRKNLHF